MTNYEISSNSERKNVRYRVSSSFGFGLPRRSCAKAGHSFVIRHSIFVIFLMLGLSNFAAPPPSAQEILESVRMLEARQRLDLQGQLREKDNVVPFHLTQMGPLIRYSFDNPTETLQLRL